VRTNFSAIYRCRNHSWRYSKTILGGIIEPFDGANRQKKIVKKTKG
jgi:hypothetical protein